MPAILSPVRRAIQQRAKLAKQIRDDFSIGKPTVQTLDPEFAIHYWHPSRFGVRLCDDAFRKRLKAIHESLEITWHPLRQRWLVWFRKPSIQTTRGWKLLFVWEHSVTYAYLPLNELVFFNLYQGYAIRQGPAIDAFHRVTEEVKRQNALLRAKEHESDFQKNKDFIQYTKIKSIGRGSKFVHHHDGDVIPGRAERDWRRATAQTRMPEHVREQAAKDADRRADNLRRMREGGRGR